MNPSKIKIMQTLHLAFCMSVFMFTMVTLLISKDMVHFNLSLDKDPLFPLFPVIGLVFLYVGSFMFKKTLQGCDNLNDLDMKLAKYQTAFIIRSAFTEAAGLMNTAAFLISGNAAFLIVTTVSLFILLTMRPTKQGVIDVLNLQYPDTEKL